MGLRVSNTVCETSKRKVLVSPSYLTLQDISQMFWRLLFQMQMPQTGELNVELEHFALWAEPHSYSIPPSECLTHSEHASDQTTSLPLLFILIWSILYILSCRKCALLIFRSLSEIVLYVVVVLVCPWEELSSNSSQSTILILPFFQDFIILYVKYLATLHFFHLSLVDSFGFQLKGIQEISKHLTNQFSYIQFQIKGLSCESFNSYLNEV